VRSIFIHEINGIYLLFPSRFSHQWLSRNDQPARRLLDRSSPIDLVADNDQSFTTRSPYWVAILRSFSTSSQRLITSRIRALVKSVASPMRFSACSIFLRSKRTIKRTSNANVSVLQKNLRIHESIIFLRVCFLRCLYSAKIAKPITLAEREVLSRFNACIMELRKHLRDDRMRKPAVTIESKIERKKARLFYHAQARILRTEQRDRPR